MALMLSPRFNAMVHIASAPTALIEIQIAAFDIEPIQSGSNGILAEPWGAKLQKSRTKLLTIQKSRAAAGSGQPAPPVGHPKKLRHSF
jgi:hypothetical protein